MGKNFLRIFVSVFLSLIMLCLSFSSAFAIAENINTENNNPEFVISSNKAVLGKTFNVEVRVNNNPGITALQLNVNYDADYLSLKSVEHCSLFSNPSTCSESYSSPFIISWFSQQSLDENENGTLTILTFSVNDTAKTGDTKITLSYDEDNVFNSKFENVKFDTIDSTVSISDCLPGDVNRDDTINMKDLVLLQKYLNRQDVQVDSKAADVFFDNSLNMKDVVLLQKYLNGDDVALGQKQSSSENGIVYNIFSYGESELGKELMCHSFTPKNYTSTVLLNFAIHGYEDEYAADGQVLVDTAYSLIDYYRNNSDKLGNTRLLIIPCANPDGLYDGNSNNGFGRCNANGVDLNRDFDANYVSRSDSRYYTPYAFSASESRALRDLVNAYSADVVIDFHGWLNYTIGDYELAQVFYDELGLSHYVSFTTTNAGGYFSNWAHQQGALALLVEFTNSHSVSIEKVVNAVNRILIGDYLSSEKDNQFDDFDTIDCYTLSEGKVTTYQYFDTPFSSASYIDGATDKVTILDVYKNGWVKVQYPLYSGSNKIAYCYLSDFISDDEMVDKFYLFNVLENTTVYKRNNLAESFGTVYPTDKIYVVGEKEDLLQIIYPLDSGGYKMGWIKNNTI